MGVILATCISAAVAASVVQPTTVVEQGRSHPGPDRGARSDQTAGGANLRPAEIQRIFDGYVLVQIRDALSLSNDQFAQLLPRLKALQDLRRVHQMERTRLVGELQRLSRPGAPGADDGALADRLKALRESDARFASELQKAYAAVDELLDVRQQARFRVFEEGIERKKLDLLLRARQNQSRPPPRQQHR